MEINGFKANGQDWGTNGPEEAISGVNRSGLVVRWCIAARFLGSTGSPQQLTRRWRQISP